MAFPRIIAAALAAVFIVGCQPAPRVEPTAAPPARMAASGVATPAPAATASTASPQSAASPAARLAPTFDEAAVASFYSGKTIRLLVGSSAGGGYDAYARLIAPTLGKYLPGNPDVIVENMPGAGGTVMANYLFNIAPGDGTVIGILQNTSPLAQLVREEGVQFDAPAFNWLGSLNSDTDVCVVRSDRPIDSFQDLFNQEMTVGGTGPTSVTESEPRMLNGLLGTRFKLVPGYPGTNELNLAIERGELDGRCGWAWSSVQTTRPEWVQGDPPFVRVLVQTALRKHPDLPHVPLATEFARDEDERGILEIFLAGQLFGRPLATSPNVPADRVEALRAALAKSTEDPELRARAEQSRLEIDFLTGSEVQQLVQDMFGQPAERIQRLQRILQS
jgi:tripartite-type tricarboxylate transporter receptor subunit TctC